LLKKVLEDVKKFSKIPKKESVELKAEQELEVTPSKVRSAEVKAECATKIGACYDLFAQLLADKPQVQWDHIIMEVHNKDPWTGLDGTKHKGLFVKSPKFLEDCITFHKLTLFNCDAAEQQKAYMMGSLRKPNLMIIQNHMSHCETMNGYITLLPTLQDSTSMVTSIEKGNIVFNDATLAGIVLATTLVEWWNQYEMNHRTVPESPRAMLQDLENIEKVFIEKTNDKA
jgi:hypothetical protein